LLAKDLKLIKSADYDQLAPRAIELKRSSPRFCKSGRLTADR
jgi:hypothetical protein